MTNHIYKNHVQQVEEVLSREPFALPRVEIIDGEKPLRGLEGLLALRYENLNLVNISPTERLPQPWRFKMEQTFCICFLLLFD